MLLASNRTPRAVRGALPNLALWDQGARAACGGAQPVTSRTARLAGWLGGPPLALRPARPASPPQTHPGSHTATGGADDSQSHDKAAVALAQPPTSGVEPSYSRPMIERRATGIKGASGVASR